MKEMTQEKSLSRKGSVEAAFEIARHFLFDACCCSNTAWCSRCESLVPMVEPATAASLERTTVETIALRVQHGELHAIRAGSGMLCICLSSVISGDGRNNERERPRTLVRLRPAAG